jgi:RNA methyltransferase, TrmH family
MAVFRQRWAEVPVTTSVMPEQTWLALETIRDPGNLGTILRTAEAVGVAGVVLAGACCDAFSRECVRATMGSIFAVPVARLPGEDLAGFIAAWPGCSVATHLLANDDFRDVRYERPVLLVMGSEGPGLSDVASNACRQRVKIPMVGSLDSFNLAVATALTLYQIQGDSLSLRPKGHR